MAKLTGEARLKTASALRSARLSSKKKAASAIGKLTWCWDGRARGRLVSLVERRSRYTLLGRVASKQAEPVAAATIGLLAPHKEHTQTITADNGKEFADHTTISQALDAAVYFAHPYHAWERGLNENTNGLIRQYIPKGTALGCAV